jgi:hypothetical protein
MKKEIEFSEEGKKISGIDKVGKDGKRDIENPLSSRLLKLENHRQKN